jgi:steroid 5-alpha reductase family enzyme
MLSEILIQAALVVFCHSVFWFIFSLIAKRNDVADIAWGLGFILIVLFLSLVHPTNAHSRAAYTLVIIWGIRLAVHIGRRNSQKKEDFRYAKWRNEWGNTFFWRSFVQVYLLQGFFMFIIASPLYELAEASYSLKQFDSIWEFPFLFWIALWLLGFLWQAIADYQLVQFKKRRQPGEIMTTGLWKFSRHPNYFGEILMWWAIWLMTGFPDFGLWAIISPLTITFLLAKVSGIPMLEAKYKGNPAFEAYKQSTPDLIPWFPKKEKT